MNYEDSRIGFHARLSAKREQEDPLHHPIGYVAKLKESFAYSGDDEAPSIGFTAILKEPEPEEPQLAFDFKPVRKTPAPS